MSGKEFLSGLRFHEFSVELRDWPPAPPPPSPEELALDEDARTGNPRAVSIHLSGLEYYGKARVIRRGRGEYTFETLSKLRRRLSRPPNQDPSRLPR